MRGVLVVCCMALLGCVSIRMAREAEAPPGDPDLRAEAAYQRVLEQHTLEKAVLDGLNMQAVLAATLQQPAFAQARIRRIGSLRAWPEDKIQLEWENESRRLEGLTEFFVGLQTASLRHNDLDMRSSLWQLSLRVGNQVYFPSHVRRLGRSTVDMRSLYPYMGLAWVGYRVQFPVELKPPFGATLVISSSLGRVAFLYVAQEEGQVAAQVITP